MMSTRAASLFKSLINMLVIDLVVSFNCTNALVASCVVNVVMRTRHGSLAFLMSMSIAELYPLFSNMVVLLYIGPYRQALCRMFGLDRFSRTTPVQQEMYSFF